MAALESYSPCPCGSGQKYKWCCQKAEPYAERVQRLTDTGQVEGARAALDEGLARLPGNPWLLMRKAILLARENKLTDAVTELRGLLAKHPDHAGAHNFLVRAVIETEGAAEGAAQLQRALSAVAPENHAPLTLTAQLVGMMLGDAGHPAAALAHMNLAEHLGGDDDEQMVEQTLRMIEGNPSISAWLRHPYEYATVPGDLAPAETDRFTQALGWAGDGAWASAASAFETLAADGVAEADRNLGLCRLWMADDAGASSALRRYIPSLGDVPEAVDLEALCQLIAPPRREDLVGHVQLIWSIRSRDRLLAALRADASVDDEGRGPIDPDDPDSPEVDLFALLDRPKPAGGVAGVDVKDIPRIEARVSVGAEIAALDLIDDGRLERLSARFTGLAGAAIPPAHPRTKVLGPVPRLGVAMQAELWIPEDAPREETSRITREEHARIVREVWPETGMPYLDGRTPRRAAEQGGYHVPLRAAVCQFESGQVFFRSGIDFNALRRDLGIPAEPPIDPATVDVEGLHLARLHLIPVEGLDDDKLVALFFRAHRYVMPLAMERAAEAIVTRPQVLDREDMDRVIPFADLANLALSRQQTDEAFSWLERGRQADKTGRNAVRWDFLEVRLKARSEPPESWVPLLAVLLERHGQDRDASTQVMTNLMDMGLVEMSPNPDSPGNVVLDTRRLQAVLSRYGPKITTASGRLGVSATQGKIWTPGDPGAGATGTGGVWTPGASATPPPSGEKSKLIIPGH